MFISPQKENIYEKINKAELVKDFDLQNQLYQQLAQIKDLTDEDYFNIGLFYKKSKNWEKSIEYNLKSIELNPDNAGANWNLGIAYTAISDFANASKFWKYFKVETNPISEFAIKSMGLIPIRLLNGEVVWCDRIDPARAKIKTIPLLDSNHNFEDLLLIDWAPDGYRRVKRVDIPVFNEIDRLEVSKFKTISIKIFEKKDSIINEIKKIKDYNFEIWSDSINFICEDCSKGRLESKFDYNGKNFDFIWIGLAVQKDSEVNDFINLLIKKADIDNEKIKVDK